MHTLLTHSPLLIIGLMTVLGIAAIVSILRRATRQREDLDLVLQERLLFDRLAEVMTDRPSPRPPLRPVAPTRRASEPVPAQEERPLGLLTLDHVSQRKPLKLALEKA